MQFKGKAKLSVIPDAIAYHFSSIGINKHPKIFPICSFRPELIRLSLNHIDIGEFELRAKSPVMR
ncbi:MAG: hypothetical protein V7L04_03950 [Nostoc sp.]|uniref:hypothetical protein n=1 Tax=Nostoc sp. S13 TaxID=3019266 RepID=UPI00262ABCC8|nr:hypothetical protein [Nostoc sp. S13]